MDIPRIISVDDHVVEPPDLWTSRMPARFKDLAPRVTREVGAYATRTGAGKFLTGPDVPGAAPTDVWRYDKLVWPLLRGYAYSGSDGADTMDLVTYDDILPGTYDRTARLADMDLNHTDVSLCFPTVPRFCGQIFLEAEDKELALLCVQAYNDWMIEEWCGTERPARLIPLTLIPLWDAELAAAEVRRCADKGSHAIAFSECPPHLGLPSIFSDHWDPLFHACQDTDTVINMHVGSSSRVPVSAKDAPADMILCNVYLNALSAFSDWLYSGTLELFPGLRIALSESQAGWIPFVAQRIDNTWVKGNEKYAESTARRAKELPSSVIPGRVFGCVFDDVEGLRNRERVGFSQILFETDYPHTDSTYPHSKKAAAELCEAAGLSEAEAYQFLRGNAIKAYGLDRYFGISR